MAFKMAGAPFQNGRPTKKERLNKRADKAHERGYNRGADIAGYRTVAEPRTLSTMEIPMTAREMKLREKAVEAGKPKEKKPKVKSLGHKRTLLPQSVVPKGIKRNKCGKGKCPKVSWLQGGNSR
tara:strand:+ start:759 stop:1130 length:372 start_codon:yes stop_codon:yes gene_type:complete